MTIKEADIALCERAPVQICGTSAKRLGCTDHVYSRIASVSKRQTSKGITYFDVEVVDESAGRCRSVLHVDPKDVKIADSAPDIIKQKIHKRIVGDTDSTII